MRSRVIWMLALGLAASVFAACDKKGDKLNEKLGAPGNAAVWQKIPQDAFFAMAFHRPEKTGPQLKEALTQMGLFGDFYKNADIDDLQRNLGIDPFQPETLAGIGLDLSKGVAMAFDGKMITKNSYYSDYSATINIHYEPTFFAVAAISDKKKINDWINNIVAKQPGSRMMTPPYKGDADVPLTLLVREISYQPGTEEVVAAFASNGGYLYAFFLDAALPTHPEMPNPIEQFVSDLPDFFARTKTPITAKNSFQTVSQQMKTKDDCMLYVDIVGFSEQFTLFEKRDIIYLPTDDENILRYQQDEKRYQNDDVQRDIRELNTIRMVAAAFPAFGMGGALEKDKMSCEGYSMVGASWQEDMRAVLVPSVAAPSYGTIMPADTGFVYRESLNLLALKKLVFRFVSGNDLADMERDWLQFVQISQAIGLDMEKDILGALTGHLAFGAPDLGSFLMPWFMFIPREEQAPQIPPLTMLIQLTSAEAGDKIIAALQPMLDAFGVRSESVEGEKLYWAQADNITFAWARVNNTMLGSTSLDTAKEMIKNIKKPGASFVDKLPNPLSKSLITDKNANGCTADVGNIFSTIAKYDKSSSDPMLYQLGSSLGSSTMKISYENNGIQCRGDLVLK